MYFQRKNAGLATVLMATVVYAPFFSEAPIPPSQQSLPFSVKTPSFSWQEQEEMLPYRLAPIEQSLQDFETIRNVAASLLSESIDLDPEVVSLLDKEFWTLL